MERGGGGSDASTVRRPAFSPALADARSFSLVVAEGPDVGRSFRVDGSERILVGHGESCQFRLSDRQISRRHLVLDPQGQRLRLTDLGSTNGTFVDGVAVVDVFLRGGETVRLGETAFRVDPEGMVSVPVPPAMGFGRTVGASTEMRRLYALCDRIARANVSVIIEGETGTGKEVLAESIHELSPRAKGPFIVFDCTATSPTLVESDLFGHERGAFTGAVASRRGVFEQANGGTLLIDEIGDLGPELQPKLLRALERSEVRKVGGEKFIKVDVRVLAATRRDLDREVQAGRFREDLYHRLAVARVELPPLRRRTGDVTLLANHIWSGLGGAPGSIPPYLLQRWEDSPWPGNVRELRNAVARALALGDAAEFFGDAGGAAEASEAGGIPHAGAPGSLPGSEDPFQRVLGMNLPLSEAKELLMEEFEQAYIERALERHGGNVTKAAAASHIGRRYFQRLRARK